MSTGVAADAGSAVFSAKNATVMLINHPFPLPNTAYPPCPPPPPNLRGYLMHAWACAVAGQAASTVLQFNTE